MHTEDVATRVVVTAGHVDHGKSTLVRALTGVDPDRLEEERRRGLTIDLGFAEMRTPSGGSIAFVDVPGHVRFIKNMLAGVGVVDAALFVVDATEGWKPQSEEHLRILDLLGVREGAVALTKSGLVDEEALQLARLAVADAIGGSRLATAPVFAVDSLSGFGLDRLRLALDQLARVTPLPAPSSRARLWIDRSFAVVGAGTVVTGTLIGGPLHRGEEIEVLTRHGLRTSRIRQLQSFGRECEVCMPGARVAANLTGLSRGELGRGLALVQPGRWHYTRCVDVSMSVLPAASGPVRSAGSLTTYIGTADLVARVRVVGAEAIEPGASGVARVVLPAALPLTPGDRFVMRDAGRGETIGGGEVLDVDPVLPVSRSSPDRSVDRVIAERGWVDGDHLERLTGERRPATLGNWVVDPHRLQRERRELVARVDAAGPLGLDVARLPARDRQLLTTIDELVVANGRARTAAAVAADAVARHPLLDALRAAPYAPPPPDDFETSAEELRELVARGLVVRQDGIAFSASAVDQAARLVSALLADDPDGITVSQVRGAMGTSRRFALALLALLDAGAVTRRHGDLRVAGPRLPRPDVAPTGAEPPG